MSSTPRSVLLLMGGLLLACQEPPPPPPAEPPAPTAAAPAPALPPLPNNEKTASTLSQWARARLDSGHASIHLTEGRAHLIVLDGLRTKLSVVERGRGTFTEAALAEDTPEQVDVTLNGMLYTFEEEVHRMGSKRPTADGAHGIAVSAGRLLGGQPLLPDTARYYLAQHRLPGMNAWRVARGDPQGKSTTGLSGARVLLYEGQPFGAPDGTPDKDTDRLMQLPSSLGMPYTALDRDLGLLWILVKTSDPSDTTPPEDDPLSVARVRTLLTWLGADDALIWDGGDSTALVIDDTVVEAPAAYKDSSIPFGLRFTSP